MTSRRTSRAGVFLVGVLIAMATVASCTVSESLRAPLCESDSSSALISGQSVPSAEFLVCFDAFPAGWEVGSVDIGDGGTFIAFHSDRAGGSAAQFRFEESCDTGDATLTPTEFERTNRYEWILEVEPRFKAKRFYRFNGGCVTWEFDFNADAAAALAVELGGTMQLVDRAIVNADMRAEFVDEDL